LVKNGNFWAKYHYFAGNKYSLLFMNSPLLKKALPHIIAIVIFLVVAVVFCKPVLDGKVVYQSDVIGWKGMAQQSFEFKEKHGHFPLWTESSFGGMPAYTIAMDSRSNIGIGTLSKVLTLGLPRPINYFFLACICFYILSLVAGVNPWIGIFASLAYAYCSYDPVIITTGHETKMQAIAYAPGVFAGLFLIFRKNYLWGVTLLAIFFALQLTSQHLQIVYYTLIGMGVSTLAFLYHSWKQGQLKDAGIGILLAVVAAIPAFAANTIYTLPFQEYSKETMRGGRTELAAKGDKSESHDGLSKDYAFRWSYGIAETSTLMVPDAYGGGSAGKEIGENSKFAERLTDGLGVPTDYGVSQANEYSYWGAQPFTSGPVYLGAIVCFLFIFSAIILKGWQKWALLTISGVGLLLCWGKNFSALNYFLFDHLPYYNKFQAPAMALVMPQLAFPLLCALGLQQLLYGDASKESIWRKFKTSVLVTGAILALLTMLYFSADYKGESDASLKQSFTSGKLQQLSQGKQPSPEMEQQAAEVGNTIIAGLREDRQSLYGGDLLRSILLVAAVVVLIGLYLKGKFKQGILLAGVILLSSYDVLSVSKRYLSEENFVESSDFDSNLNPSAADIRISGDPDKNFRVFDETSNPFTNAKPSYFHNSVGGYSPAKLGLYQDLIDSQLNKGNMRVFNMLNTKYFIQEDQATRQPQARLNPGAYGPCWLVKGIRYVKDGNEEMRALDSTDSRDTAIIQQKFQNLVAFAPAPDDSASIRLVENLNDKIDYSFSAKTNQFAVFSEVYYDKGWNAFIDGKKADYCRVDYILRGMAVPAGDHTIEFRFEPHSYFLGDTLSTWSAIAIYLLIIAAFVVEWRKRGKQT
jgi:hypothetical protein